MLCEKCGNEHDGSYGSGRFCSGVCARAFSTSKEFKQTKHVRCVVCKSILCVDKRASDKTCKCDKCRKRPKYNRSDATPRVKVVKTCLWCGKVGVRNQFCPTKCRQEYDWSLKKTKIIESNGVGIDIRPLKRFIIETNWHKCSICGCEEWMGEKVPLILDHINGRASDNRLENLRLVCGNCDMQLPTYKSKNKNSDRKRLGKYL